MDIQAFKELTRRVLEVTDAKGIHREAVSIPLDSDADGAARLTTPERVEIFGPEKGSLDGFIARLPALLDDLDLTALSDADELIPETKSYASGLSSSL